MSDGRTNGSRTASDDGGEKLPNVSAPRIPMDPTNKGAVETGDDCAPYGGPIDSSGATITFVESPILETMLSLGSLVVDWYDDPWVEEAREIMGVSFLRDLRALLNPFRMGVDLFELAVPKANIQEVEPFIERLKKMPLAEFSYYAFGRLIPMKGGELAIDPDAIRDLIENYGVYTHYLARLTEEDWQSRGPQFQKGFARLLEEFWNRYFKSRYSSLAVQHSISIAKNEAYARQRGFEELYRLITGRDKLHLLLSGDYQLREMFFVPVVNATHPYLIYTGHHDLTVIYRAARTPERIEALTRREKQLVAISRALGDKTRFQIVKLLFQHYHALNGQNIADRMHLSKSVVSKHLQQLKEAGIVQETSPDRRNNIYNIDVKVLQEISPGLLEVLRG